MSERDFEALGKLHDDVVFKRAEFDKLLKTAYRPTEYSRINSREIMINGKTYTIDVLQVVHDGEYPDSMNTRIFVIEETEKDE